jgi:hypothetical protein
VAAISGRKRIFRRAGLKAKYTNVNVATFDPLQKKKITSGINFFHSAPPPRRERLKPPFLVEKICPDSEGKNDSFSAPILRCRAPCFPSPPDQLSSNSASAPG